MGRFKSTFPMDQDGIVPFTDEEYFPDDIVGLFINFISDTFGKETLERNLQFISQNLGSKGMTPRECLRNYFISDFFRDHCNTYALPGMGKRPIYWLFDSGKQNGFKALIYIQSYDRDTVAKVRTDYLHKTQNAIEKSLNNAEYIINTTSSATDRAKATRNRDKYMKQLAETRLYDQALAHISLQRIEINLDDGVKVNYAKFQGVEISNEGTKKQTIDLLAKI